MTRTPHRDAMDKIRDHVQALVDDLGPVWFFSALAVLVASLLLRTWFLFGLVGGVLGTLYIHPFQPEITYKRPDTFLGLRPDTADGDTKGSNATARIADDDLSSVPFPMRTQIRLFSDQFIRDYVRWWYQPPNFPTDEDFPNQCQHSLNCMLSEVYSSFSRKDIILYLDAIFTNSVATMGAVLDDLRVSFKLRTNDDKVGLSHFGMSRPDATLTRMLNGQERKANIRRTVEAFLKRYLHEDDLRCLPIVEFLRQVLAQSVFESSLAALAHRDTVNAAIVSLFGDRRSAPNESTESRAQFVAALDEASQKVASAAQDAETRSPVIGNLVENSAIEEEEEEDDDDDDISSVLLTAPETPSKPARGRRLSFKNKSVSSISDVVDEDGNRIEDKRKSFLKRTGSLLSKSRSRSTSPAKKPEQENGATSPGHTRSRSISPFKKSARTNPGESNTPLAMSAQRPTLFQAELIVSDASDIKASEFNSNIAVIPKFSILISPVKQENYASSGGIGVFRSYRDVQTMDAQLRSIEGEVVPKLPEIRSMSYAALEIEMLTYLVSVTRSKVLAESLCFREFCRPDLVSEDRPEEKLDSWNMISDGGKSILGSLRKGTELMRPSTSTPKHDPLKRVTEDSAVSPRTAHSTNEELRALFQAKEEELKIAAQSSSSPQSQAPVRPNGPSRTTAQSKSRVPFDRNRIDLQTLVSQSMELLATFYALSSRTWTIRKQLLNLLRSLLLSKNSVYSHAFLVWLEESVLFPLSDPESAGEYMRLFNDFMFPKNYTRPEPLSSEQSAALASEARTLFTQRAMPSAIRNLMGAPPTSEALGILFDAMQDPEFSLGLVSLLSTETLRMLMAD